MRPISVIAFDIGGVLATTQRIKSDALFDQHFLELQRGLITSKEFISHKKLRGENLLLFSHMLQIHTNYKLLASLTTDYIFASNIIELHFENFISQFIASNYARSHSTLSFSSGYLKPDPDFFALLIKKINKKPENILFIDDKLENIQAAQKLNLQGAWCPTPALLSDLLDKYKVLKAQRPLT
jgi:HAD superfamily hydrolase (TIGR01509 family)